MERATAYGDAFGKVIIRAVGLCALFFFLFANPLVLRPRFWTASVIARSMAIDATLLVVGAGLVGLRRWAAVLSSAIGLYLAIELGVAGAGAGLLLSLTLLIPLPLTFIFWRTLVWGDKRRDPLLAAGGLALSALVYYAAFLIHHA